jgi:hypothetical protein
MICIRPFAPMTLSAIGLKFDSTAMTASISNGSTRVECPAAYARRTNRSSDSRETR